MLRSLAFVAGFVVLAGCGRFGESSTTPANAERVRKLESEVAALRRSIAGADAYICTIMTAHSVQDDGGLKPETDSFYNIGGVFAVDRQTGVYRGGVGTNATDDKREVVFVPPDNAFYVASTSRGPNKGVDYLAVQDFKPGRLKPFVLATFGYD